MRKRVWYNRGLSNVHDAIVLARAEDRTGELRFLASHTRAHSPVLEVADEGWLEPEGMGEEEYVGWCLAVCREREVDLFIPGSRRLALARYRAEFERVGTRLSVLSEAPVLERLEHKGHTYQDLEGTGVGIPEYRVVRSLEEFDRGYAELRSCRELLCIKPTVGIYGAGFFVLEEGGSEMERLLSEATHRIGLDAFRRALAGADGERELMLMEYLPGTERSVDSVAHQGELVAAVSRAKETGYQRLETEGPAIEVARELARRYHFHGQFNLQTKDREGTPYFLEVNSRMSGGMSFACEAGVVLPYWNIVLALGLREPQEVPRPRAGGRVVPVNASLLLGERRGSLPLARERELYQGAA